MVSNGDDKVQCHSQGGEADNDATASPDEAAHFDQIENGIEKFLNHVPNSIGIGPGRQPPKNGTTSVADGEGSGCEHLSRKTSVQGSPFGNPLPG